MRSWHELLVRYQMDFNQSYDDSVQNPPFGMTVHPLQRKITDEDVREANRALQNFSLSAGELARVLERAGFPEESTRADHEAQEKRIRDYYKKCEQERRGRGLRKKCDYWEAQLGIGSGG